MQTQPPHRRFRLTALLAAALSTIVPASGADTYKWTVQYLIDQSQAVFGESQKVWPRRNRGLAVSPDGKWIYAGYHHGGNGQGEVRKLAVSITDDFARATVRVLRGPAGKNIACDDKGRVYIANQGEVLIYDANLSVLFHSIPINVCEGVAVAREGKDLILYAADRQLGLLMRFVLDEKGDEVTGATPAGFDGSGTLTVNGGSSLRAVEVDAKGSIWVTDHEADRVFRISKDGKTIDAIDVENATDIGFDGNRAYVTRGTDRQVAVIDTDTMKVLGNLGVPWDELELSPKGNNGKGSLSGIVVIPGKGFLVSNETGQTAGQKSSYGRADEFTDFVEGKVYRDAYADDNDPILLVTEQK